MRGRALYLILNDKSVMAAGNHERLNPAKALALKGQGQQARETAEQTAPETRDSDHFHDGSQASAATTRRTAKEYVTATKSASGAAPAAANPDTSFI